MAFPEHGLPPKIFTGTWALESVGLSIHMWNDQEVVNSASAAWPLADLAIYVPFLLCSSAVFVKLWCANGVAVAGNIDMGIYTVDETRIVSNGGVAQAGLNAPQDIDITDTLLGPGIYYLAVSLSNVGGTVRRNALGNLQATRITGIAQEANAYPLPAVATMVTVTNDYVPMVGALPGPRTVI